ncbi:uncharacterized protein RBU33_010941 [Hipposideros larvatus]
MTETLHSKVDIRRYRRRCAAASGAHPSPSKSCHHPSRWPSLSQEGIPVLAFLVSFMGTPQGGFLANLAITRMPVDIAWREDLALRKFCGQKEPKNSPRRMSKPGVRFLVAEMRPAGPCHSLWSLQTASWEPRQKPAKGCRSDGRAQMTDYLTGVDQKIPDRLIKTMFLGEAETQIRYTVSWWRTSPLQVNLSLSGVFLRRSL